MKNPFLRALLLLAVLSAILPATLLSFISCSAKPQESSSRDLAGVFEKAGLRLLRERIPSRDFTLPIASTGQQQTLSGLKGKVVFLNFWATWCGPCRAEMPSMEALFNRYKDKGLEMLAVNCLEKENEVIAFMESNGLTFPTALDLEGRVSNSYGIQGIPTTFLIDRSGNLVVRLVGSIDWDTPEIHAVIELLLN